MRESLVHTKCDNKVSDENNRTPVFICNCSSFSTSSIQSSSETKNPGVISESKLRLLDSLNRRGEGGTRLVVSKSAPVKRSIFNSINSSVSNKFGCLNSGMGCTLQGSGDRWPVVSPGEGTPFKHIRAESCKASHSIVSRKVSNGIVDPHSNGQHCRPNISKKMGGTRCPILTAMSKEIWKYLLAHQITITVEYLPGILNVITDRQSRNVKDSSEWMLNTVVFRALCRARGTPCTDLFASRLSHQVPVYFSWKIDPYSRGQDAFHERWTHVRGYAFPLFCLIGKFYGRSKPTLHQSY